MFCDKCGKTVSEDSVFCPSCGASLSGGPPPGPPAETSQPQKKGGSGFFYSPAGIALVIILAVAVIAGITIGVIFAVKGGGDDGCDAETAKVWEEYESIVEDDSTDIAQINMDPNALAKSQDDLKKTQQRVENLEKALKQTGGTKARQTGTSTSNSLRDQKADQLAATLAAYDLYIQKMNQLFGALIGANLMDPNVVNNLNTILADLQRLGNEVKTLANDFLDNNNAVATTNFDPAILSFPATATTDIEQAVVAAQTAEAQRLAAEQAAAEAQAAELERQAAEKQSSVSCCPSCGAAEGVGGWCKVNTGWHCFNCGYHLLEP